LDIDHGGIAVIFAKKQEKIYYLKKIISRNNFEKKEKNLGVGQKNGINYA